MISAIRGTHDEKTLAQLNDVASRAHITALMADGHLGYIMPVGGVAAYRDQVSVAGVGFDIGCGNTAALLAAPWSRYAGVRSELADEIANRISFGIGRKNTSLAAPVDHPLFEDARWGAIPANVREPLRQKAREQLGTVGSGNHYVDLFEDTMGLTWIGVHFGSRGLGHTIATGFMNLAQGKRWGERGAEVEALLGLYTPLGHDYWQAKSLASEYAFVGREWVVREVASILGSEVVTLVANHHNDAWVEEHFGINLVVVRKGATPAFPGQLGFVGGSMGDVSVILQGRDSAESAANLYSTVHGAGRVMSRTEAAGKRHRHGRDRGQLILNPDGSPKSAGKVSPEMMHSWLAQADVVLRGGGLDESPHAYRRLPDVLAAQGPSIEVLQTLSPRIVLMAGADEFDPYKD